MPTQRLSMRRIEQLPTIRFGAGASTRAIGRQLGIAPSTVREYLGRATAPGIGWPLAADVTDESLMARLFVNAGARFHADPAWAALVRGLKRPGVNLLVLCDEYRAVLAARSRASPGRDASSLVLPLLRRRFAEHVVERHHRSALPAARRIATARAEANRVGARAHAQPETRRHLVKRVHKTIDDPTALALSSAPAVWPPKEMRPTATPDNPSRSPTARCGSSSGSLEPITTIRRRLDVRQP
jgi:hypothetical protein